jgi:hypothetical protein
MLDTYTGNEPTSFNDHCKNCEFADRDILPREVISSKLSVPNAERIFFTRNALRAGFAIGDFQPHQNRPLVRGSDQGDRGF